MVAAVEGDAEDSVAVEGRVEGRTSGTVHGCGRSANLREEGFFTLEVPLGPPCQVAYASQGMGVGPWVDPADPPELLVLEPLPAPSMAERMAQLRAEIQVLEDSPDPVDVVLDEPTLDPEVRALLERWSNDLHRERAIEIDGLRQTIASWTED